MIFFVIARAESPWRSTVFQKANRTYPYASIACSGLPRRSLRSLLAMTWCVVLERYTDSLHILSSRGRSPWRSTVFQKANRTCPYASIACSGLPRQTVVFLAMTNCMLWPNRILHFFILLSSRGRSPWRSTVSRKPSRTVRMRPLHAVDCRVPRSAFSSQ